jgi:prolyl-tRNA editing enzyme YbaK/EbsC (Cys-tRNA(Pro) deacylase)
MALDNLTSLLDRAGVPYDLLQHDHTESGIAEAQALGVPVDEVAKTLILDTPSGHVRAVKALERPHTPKRELGAPSRIWLE